MSRELWQRRLLESVFVFYTADLEHALSKIKEEPGQHPLDALAHLRPFFELPDAENDYYENIMLEKYRIDVHAPGVLSELDIPDTPYNKAISRVPKSNEEIAMYIYFAKDLEKRLEDLSDEELAAAYRMLEKELLSMNNERRKLNGRERDMFSFFNMVRCDANFQFWQKAAVWTLDECVSLSMGKEPVSVNSSSLELHKRGLYFSPFRQEFRTRLNLIRRAHSGNVLSEPTEPRRFVNWARSLGWDLPSQLTEGLESAHTAPPGSRAVLEPNGVSLEMLYRILLGMAISRFEHRTSKNSNATAAIEKELRDLKMLDDAGSKTLGDITVSNDTIRRALQAAAEHLDVSWSDAIRWTGFKRPRNKSEI